MNPNKIFLILDHSKPLCVGDGLGQSVLQFGFRCVVTEHQCIEASVSSRQPVKRDVMNIILTSLHYTQKHNVNASAYSDTGNTT